MHEPPLQALRTRLILLGTGGGPSLVARVPNATALKRSIVAGQTSVEHAGRVAQAAGVGRDLLEI